MCRGFLRPQAGSDPNLQLGSAVAFATTGVGSHARKEKPRPVQLRAFRKSRELIRFVPWADILSGTIRSPSRRTHRVLLLQNPAQLTSFLIREVPCLGQELRLRWFSASIVFAREILSEKLGRVCRLVGYGVVGAGQTDNDLVIPPQAKYPTDTASH